MVKDSNGASAIYQPTFIVCACGVNSTACVEPDDDDSLNTDSKFVIQGCECKPGYEGRLCEKDLDACAGISACYQGVACIDKPPPATEDGYECGPCPSGYNGDGKLCAGEKNRIATVHLYYFFWRAVCTK